MLKNMEVHFNPLFLVTLFSAVLLTSSFASAESDENVVASITWIEHQQNALSGTVTLSVTIHAPIRLAGFQFLIVTDSAERSVIRKKYPIGSLQMLALPSKTVEELESQIEGRSAVEESLDTGIDPRVISQGFLMPSVALAELPKGLVKFVVDAKSILQDKEP